MEIFVPRTSLNRGRPRSDPALVLRNKLWADAVKGCIGKSWDALDQKFLSENENERADGHRPRVFWNIYHWGFDPRASMRLQANLDLVETVAAHDKCGMTRDLYFSALWELLSPPGVSIDRLLELNDVLLERRGFYQASDEDVAIGRWQFPEVAAFRAGDESVRRRGIASLVDSATLDDLALLAIQFRVAMGLVLLDEANDYLHGLYSAINTIGDRWCLYGDLSVGLQALVKTRLILV